MKRIKAIGSLEAATYLLFEPRELLPIQINFISKLFSFLLIFEQGAIQRKYPMKTSMCWLLTSVGVVKWFHISKITVLPYWNQDLLPDTHILGWNYFKFRSVEIFAHEISLFVLFMLLTSIYLFFSVSSEDIKQCVHMAQNGFTVVNHSGDLVIYNPTALSAYRT